MIGGWRRSRGGRSHGRSGDRAVVEGLRAWLSSPSLDGAGLIDADAVLMIDRGARTPVTAARGRGDVAAGLRSLMTPATTAAPASVNGSSGITLVRAGRVVGVITAEVRSGRLVTVWAVCDSRKLGHWNPADRS